MIDHFQDVADSPMASYSRHPVEDIEPEEVKLDRRAELREMAWRATEVIQHVIGYIDQADNPKVALWQVAYALGLSMCEGISMQRTADKFRVTRAHISGGAVRICKRLNLEPSFYMRKEEQVEIYRKCRNSQVTKS